MTRLAMPASFKVFLSALIVSASLVLLFNGPAEPTTDDRRYDNIAYNIACGHGFSISEDGPCSSTMLVEPLYPAFLASLYKVFGHNINIVVAAQIVIFAATCLLSYKLAYHIFGERIAGYAGYLTAFSPALASYPRYLLSETLFAFLLCLAVYYLTKALNGQKMASYFISGIALAAAALCKSLMAPYFVVAAAAFILMKTNRIGTKEMFRSLVLFAIPFLMIVGMWSARNHYLFGTYEISLRGGAALWERAQKSDKGPDSVKHEIVYNFSEYLGGKLFPGVAGRPRDVILEGSRKAYYKNLELKGQGNTPLGADRIMRKEAFAKIRVHPIRFLVYIPVELVKMTAFVYVPMLNEPQVIDRFLQLKYGNTILSSIRGAFRILAYPILILAVIGMIFNRHLWRNWFFLFAAIVYVNLVYSMLFAMGRYAVPLVPFYSVFAAAGFIALIDRRKREAR